MNINERTLHLSWRELQSEQEKERAIELEPGIGFFLEFLEKKGYSAVTIYRNGAFCNAEATKFGSELEHGFKQISNHGETRLEAILKVCIEVSK